MTFEQLFERFVLLAIIGYLLSWIFSVLIMSTQNARHFLAAYSFFMMGIYIFRGWFFRHPYDKIEIVGCGLAGVACEFMNLISTNP